VTCNFMSVKLSRKICRENVLLNVARVFRKIERGNFPAKVNGEHFSAKFIGESFPLNLGGN
ncbi:MAG: hypothetical protein O7D30_08470, partial [Rickettsia endosymbiont of Ixodes persulcatus]|nr:hypothetical protein [Rickettsia endosymbiont of Ixodes persulcatus]